MPIRSRVFTRPGFSLSGYLHRALIVAACLALHATAAPQPESTPDAEPETDLVFERGSGKPYDPDNNARKLTDMQRQNLLRLGADDTAAELEKLPAEQKQFAEQRIEQMREAIAQARAEEETRQQLAKADWIKGPKTIALAEGVTLNLPAGTKYLAPAEVKKILGEDAGSTDNATLAYVHALDDRWKASLALLDTGVIDTGKAALLRDPKEALDRLKQTTAQRLEPDQSTVAQLSSQATLQTMLMRWVIAPEYDAALHTLEWASTNGGLSGAKQVEYNLFQLGKTQTAFMTVSSQDLFFGADEILTYRPEIQRVMAGVEFAPGYRYADAKASDPVSRLGLEHLVFGPPTAFEQKMEGLGRAIAAQEEQRKEKIFALVWKLVLLGVIVAVFLVGKSRPDKFVPDDQVQPSKVQLSKGPEDREHAQ